MMLYTNQLMRRWPVAVAGLICLALLTSSVTAQNGPTSKQRQQARKMDAAIKRAGRLYQNKKFKESAEIIAELQADLETYAKDAGKPVLELATPLHEKLTTARRLLVEAGETLPALKPLPEPTAADGSMIVSFARDVSAILNNKCGNCHVRQTRGMFSLATFQSLMSGIQGAPVVVPNKPDESRLIEIIESGDMPQGGLTVTDEELDKLKQWIAQGANFDSESPDANIATLPGAMNTRRRPRAAEIMRPRGNETVSFSRDIAPVLVENCRGCHFEPQNARGGLNLTSFGQLMRGGDSGNIISFGNASDSLMIQHLKGEGGKPLMPPRRGPLDAKVIDQIATWITEGAAFDGRQAAMNLRTVADIAKAESATHTQLTAERQQTARRRWKMVMSDIEANQIESDNFFVLGTPSPAELKKYDEFAESVVKGVQSELRLDKQAPLIKGQISLFVFNRRYDYNEFGKMIEGRDLPKSWRSHWGYDTVNAYNALLDGSRSESFDSVKPEFIQRIAAVTVASLGSEVPPWFANGAGYAIAEKLVDDKSIVKQWQESAATASQSMQRPTDFVQNRIPEDDAALVGYAFVKMLMSQRKQYNRLLRELKESADFEQAFVNAYSAPPNELIEAMFGNGVPQNQRRNRGGNRGR